MAGIDSKVAAVLDRLDTEDSDDEEALIARLEADDDHEMSALREQRLQQLHSEMSRAKVMRESGTGTYSEVQDEQTVMEITTGTSRAVVHFFKPDFGRCGVMDRHIETLAPKHFDTRFIKINVDNAPFLVTRLKVQVLPCVISFVDGIAQDRVIGFEGLGQGDSFSTPELEARLLAAGVLTRAKMGQQDGFRPGQRTASKPSLDREDDDDWD